MSNISLDKETFFRRMKRLYAAWKVGFYSLYYCDDFVISRCKLIYLLLYNVLQAAEGDDALAKVDALVSCVGVDEDTLYSKSTALQVLYMSISLPCAVCSKL